MVICPSTTAACRSVRRVIAQQGQQFLGQGGRD
jgi:hypothetical protein